MPNCPRCSRFYSAFVRPICDLAECPVPADQRGEDSDTAALAPSNPTEQENGS